MNTNTSKKVLSALAVTLLPLYLLVMATSALAATTEPIAPLQEQACRTVDSAALDDSIDPVNGLIPNGATAVKLIQALIKGPGQNAPSCPPSQTNYVATDLGGLSQAQVAKGDFIIHTVVFGPNPATGNQPSQPVVDQTWYLLHDGKFLRPGRLLGTKKLWFIYLHLQKDQKISYQVQYNFTVTDAVPANVQNLNSFLGIIGAPSSTKNLLSKGATPPPSYENVWGGKQITMTSSTSDIGIDANVITNGKSTALDKTQTIHNEAPEWWDISAGIPIRKMSQLTFPSSGTGTVTPTQVDKKSIYGLADFYWLPYQQKQMMYNGYTLIPSLIAGLPASQKPLQKPMIALGFGMTSIQVYAGVIVAKQSDVPAGATTTAKPCTGWCPEFAFGINLTVKGLQSALKTKPANSGSSGNSTTGATSQTSTPVP